MVVVCVWWCVWWCVQRGRGEGDMMMMRAGRRRVMRGMQHQKNLHAGRDTGHGPPTLNKADPGYKPRAMERPGSSSAMMVNALHCLRARACGQGGTQGMGAGLKGHCRIDERCGHDGSHGPHARHVQATKHVQHGPHTPSGLHQSRGIGVQDGTHVSAALLGWRRCVVAVGPQAL